jgi:hypothetical protein
VIAELTAAVVLAAANQAGMETFPPDCGQPKYTWKKLDPYAGMAYMGRCKIAYDRSVKRMTRQQQCMIAVHEHGHLAGMKHSKNRTSIMFKAIGNYTRVPRACR